MQEADHHGDRFFKEAAEQGNTQQRIREKIAEIREQSAIGATGTFEDGVITPDDEGAIRFAVSAEAGNVILAFGKRIEWLGISPKIAIQLADALVHWAKNARIQTQR